MLPMVLSLILAGVLLLNTGCVLGDQDCPGGGWLFRNRCYWIISEPTMPWQDANLYCSKFGSDLQLVTIPDSETNDFLVEKLEGVRPSIIDYVWIGLHRFAGLDDWRWVDGGPANFTNWRENQYDITNHHCAYLRMFQQFRGKWDHDQCQYAGAFICSETYKRPICPNGGTFFRNRCFWLGGKGTLPMAEADKACQDEFGEDARLPVIRDAEVNAFIGKLRIESWLGLKKSGTEWKWVDGSPVTYEARWYRNNQVYEEYDCAIVWYADSIPFWRVASCASEHHYICSVPDCAVGPDSNCTVPCTACVSKSVCFHSGECRCLVEFDGMTCDKGNFSMAIHGPKNTNIGESVELMCKTNLPVRDVEFEWRKVGTGGKDVSIIGTVLSNHGAYRLSIANVTSEDEGTYICIVTYMIGQISQLQLRNIHLEISYTGPAVVQGTSTTPSIGLFVSFSILVIACVVLLVGIIILMVRRHSTIETQDRLKMSEGLVE